MQGLVALECRALSAAEKKNADLTNELREKGSFIETLRRNELAYKDELERIRQTLAKYTTLLANCC